MKHVLSYKDSRGEYLHISISENEMQIETTDVGDAGCVIFKKDEIFEIANKLIELCQQLIDIPVTQNAPSEDPYLQTK